MEVVVCGCLHVDDGGGGFIVNYVVGAAGFNEVEVVGRTGRNYC